MSTTNKYFTLYNSSFVSMKESLNRYLNDMLETSMINEIKNPDFKYTYDNTTMSAWNFVLPISSTIDFDTSMPQTVIEYENPGGGEAVIEQNIAEGLLPNTDYALTIEIESSTLNTITEETTFIEFAIEGNGLVNLKTKTASSTISEALKSSTNSTGRQFLSIYFRTPAIVGNNIKVQLNLALSQTITLYTVNCHKGLAEFYKAVPSTFFVDSTKYENNVWKLTNDGVVYKKILRDGDIAASEIPVEELIDDYNNVYYHLNIYDEEMSLAPSHLSISDVAYNVNQSFVDVFDAYKVEHVLDADNALVNGLHLIPDTATGTKYNITVNGSNLPVIAINGNVSDATKADYLYSSYNVVHSKGGEHVFLSTSGSYDKKLVLTFDETSGVGTLTTAAYTKVAIPVTDSHSDVAVYFLDSTNNTVSHDINGNHIIKDTQSRLWKLKIKNAAFNYIPVVNTLTDATFNAYKVEHDVDGRHVIRDSITGILYVMIVVNGQMVLRRANFRAITSKDEILTSYQKEHDINGYHIFTDVVTANKYKLTIANGSLVLTLQETKVNEFHPDNLNTKYLINHTTTLNNFHCHKFLDSGTANNVRLKVTSGVLGTEVIV